MRSRKWLIFSALTGMYVIAYFYRVSASVIAGDLVEDLAISSRQFGDVASVLFYAFALAQLPLGPVLDRCGPRRTLFVLGLVTATGALVFSRADGYAGALLGRSLIGVGTAGVLMGSLKVYTAWFEPRQFATLSGLQVALGNTGNLLATAPLAWAAGTVGWRQAFGVAALLSALVAFAVLVVVRDAPPGRTGQARHSLLAGWGELARSRSFWGLCLLAFFWYGSYMAVQGVWGAPYLMEVLGYSREAAANLLLLTAVGFIVGCPLAGTLSDRVLGSRKKVVAAGQLGLWGCMVLFLGPLAWLPGWLLPVVFLVFGLCVSTGPVLYAQVKELFPSSLAATALTTINFFVVIGAALTQQVMGGLVAAGGAVPADAYRQAFLFPAGGLGVAWLVYLWCRDTHSR